MQFDESVLAVMRPPVVLKVCVTTAFRGSRVATSAATLTAGHAEEAIAASNPADRPAGIGFPRVLLDVQT